MVSTPITQSQQSLATILADVDLLMNAIIFAQEEGDLESVEAATNFIESVLLPAVKDKTDALAYVLQVKLPAIAQERKEYLAQVQQWAKQPEQQIESLKAYLKLLHDSGKLENVLSDDKKLIGQQHQISFSKMSTPAVEVDQSVAEQKWTPEQQAKYGETRVEFKVLKKELANAVKNGEPLPPGVEYRYPTKITVKLK